eukprot:4034113-Ditylum_brightwellii.AAC.1
MRWRKKRCSDKASKHHAALSLAHLKHPLPSLHIISAFHHVGVGQHSGCCNQHDKELETVAVIDPVLYAFPRCGALK